MKRNVTALCLTLFATFCLAFASGQDEVADAVSPTFKTEIAAFQEKYESALARLDAEAIAEYETLKARYGEAGNLDAAIWVANQIALIKDEAPIPGGNPAAAPKSNPIEENRRAGHARFGEIYVAEMGKLYAAEIARIEEETRRLTVAGQLDSALETSNLAKRLAGQIPKAPPAKPRSNRRIPDGITGQIFTVGESHYYLFPESMTHEDAVAACQKLGGNLLSIGSEDEYDHFHTYSVENGKPLWIDLNDEEEDLAWHHASGKEASFLKWQSGEPNGGDSQKHVMIGFQGSWDMRDVNPDSRFYVICEW